MKLLTKLFKLIAAICVVCICILAYKIHLVQQPLEADDVPEWTVTELNSYKWELRSVNDNERSTTSWIVNPDGLKCDTLIIIGGVEEGENLLNGGGEWKYTGNTILMKQPVHSFIQSNSWKNWSLRDWWEVPERLREETRHTLGALDALLNYVKDRKRNDSRFTNKVVLAGGSVGATFPVILTSFTPEKVDGLMVIYGFTNFKLVIQRLLFRQGISHFDLTEKPLGFINNIKLLGVRMLSHFMGFFFGNIIQYGEIESYLPDIYETPIHFINGTNDDIVPTEAYLPLWESSPEPKSEVWVEGGHFNPGSPEDMLRIGKLMYEWTDEHGLRSCQKPHKL